MAGYGDLLATVDAINAAGFAPERWPEALASMARMVGGVAATIELIKKDSFRTRAFYSAGLPPATYGEYLDHYMKLNRRLPLVQCDPLGQVLWDYRMFDERAIEQDPFYMEFLASLDIRYFVGGIVLTNRQEFSGVCVHRSAKQGHIDKAGAALMQRLLPHVRAAFDVTLRIKRANAAREALERAFDWLADGVAFVSAEGIVLYANQALDAIARRGDGVNLAKARFEFTAAEARTHFGAALRAVGQLQGGNASAGASDFAVARPSGAPAYVVSVRPLPRTRDERMDIAANAVVFIRDPASRDAPAVGLLRAVLGLTEAEVSLAEALRAGMPLGEYATTRSVSLNTVYTHLRGIKEKTGCRRLSELIRRLNDLLAPARPQ
jgi:DNA-binding CsgD family transcriptional regulator